MLFSGDDLENIMTIGSYEESSLLVPNNILRRWNIDNKRRFLCFVTAMTFLPYGGLAKLHPPFTVAPLADGDHPTSCVSSHKRDMPT
jgi:hypothetical protein